MTPTLLSMPRARSARLSVKRACSGVILCDHATLMVEILKDNASPLAGPVYGALDMPWATLVGQIAEAYVK